MRLIDNCKTWVRSHAKPVIALIVLSYITCFMYRDLAVMDMMEARNLVTAREMLEYHNWLVPTMNGELRLAKPPFLSIFTAWTASLGHGIHDIASARLFSALCSLATILGVYMLAQVLFRDRKRSFLSAAVFATLIQVGELAKNNAWNIPQHTFMLFAIISLVLVFQNTAVKRNFVIAGMMMGLSFLIKGPVAFFALLIPFLTSYFWVYKPNFSEIRNRKLGLVICLVVTLVIAGAWPLFIWAKHGAELKATMVTESKAWGARHVEPWYFYLSFITWTGVWLVPFISMCFIKKWTHRLVKKEYHFLWIWIILTFVLLSLMPEKKMRYIYPIWIPIAFLIGTGLNAWISQQRTRFDRWVLRIHALVLTLLCGAVPVLLYHYLVQTQRMSIGALSGYAVIFIGLATVVIISVKRDDMSGIIGATLAIMSAFNLFFVPKALVIDPKRHTYDRFAYLNTMKSYQNLSLYYAKVSNEALDMRIVWFSGKRVLPIEQLNLEKTHEALLITQRNPKDIIKLNPFTYSEVVFPSRLASFDGWKVYVLKTH